MPNDSRLLLDLYSAAREIPAAQFQSFAFHRLAPMFRVDTGMWGTGVKTPGGNIEVHSCHLHDMPLEYLTSWQTVNDQDAAAEEVTKRPNQAINVHTPTLFKSRNRAGIRDMARRFEIANCLIITDLHPEIGLFHWVSLFRRDSDAHYAESDRARFQVLFPHLLEALTINRLMHLDAAYAERGATRGGTAIVDANGVVYNTDGRFEGILRLQWSQWDGRRLPPELVQSLQSGTRFRSGIVAVDVEPIGALFFLRARPKQPLDRLSPRERDIAHRFARGYSYKEIARSLALSPATVRNNLQAAYEKLGVNDKAALATLLARRL